MWRYIELFNDPTPDGLINQRYLMTMRLAELTNLKPDDKKRFIDTLFLVGKKLVATWRHYNAYSLLEDLANREIPEFEEYFEANYRGILEIIAEIREDIQ